MCFALQNNNIDNEFISKLIKEQPLNDAFSVKKTEEDATDDIQKVRYLGGEEVKDSNGETVTEEKRSKLPPFSKKEVPLTRKKGEPENVQELSQDIHNYMDKGLSFNEAWEKEMKEYPGTAKNINEFYTALDNLEVDRNKEYQYTNDVINYDEKGKGRKYKLTPKESVERDSLNKLNVYPLLEEQSIFKTPGEEFSFPATRLYQYLVKSKKLDEWQDVMTNFNPSKFIKIYDTLSKSIKEDKDKEFTADEKTDITMLLNETMRGYSKWLDEIKKKEKKSKPETRGSFTTPDGKTTDVKYPTVATLIDKNGNETVIDSKQYQENREKDAINEVIKRAEKANKDKIVQDVKDSEAKEATQPETKTEEEISPAIENEESINAANKAYLASLQEKDAKELEAEREVAEERAKRIMTQLDKATAYEEWLKNPTIISGIFGKSGLSTAKRVGLRRFLP